jgi:cytochrome P450
MESELYLTPDGKKRHLCTFISFLGGRRTCLGKTFAEVVIKYFVSIIFSKMKFSIVNEEYYKRKSTTNFYAED